MQITPPVTTWIHGFSGRMGQALREELARPEQAFFVCLGGSDQHSSTAELTAGLKKAQLILDFSSQQGSAVLRRALDSLKSPGKKILIGSTGQSEEQLLSWKTLALCQGHSCLVAANTSLGILLTLKAALAVMSPGVLAAFDIEVEETHHKNKIDAPSGTALFLAGKLAEPAGLQVVTNREGKRQQGEIGVHASRGGGIYGEHKIRFLGEQEELCITHRAYSRELLAKGALSQSRWLCMQPAGYYSLTDVQL